MRVCVLADLHGHLPVVQPCDLLLLAGDLCPDMDEEEWLDGPFRTWLHRIPARRVVAVAGNHDFVWERGDPPQGLPWDYLQDEEVVVEGVKIWGSPWQPVFGWFAFNAEEPDLERRFSLIPDDVDVLLLHGPVHGILDRTTGGVHAGSHAALAAVRRSLPSLVVSGHIHESHGEETHVIDGAPIRFINASLVDEHARPVHPPRVFDWSPRRDPDEGR